MQSGSISFDRLYDYIRKHPEVPHKDEPVFDGFRDIYLQLVRPIAAIPGWYAWTNAADTSSAIIYIGQSQSRRTSSLQARITEEFLDEFVALWATIWDSGEAVETLDRKYQGKYTAPIKRAARKAGATHVVWFGKPGLSDQELDVIEQALIVTYSPTANRGSRAHSGSYPELLTEADSALQSELLKLARS